MEIEQRFVSIPSPRRTSDDEYRTFDHRYCIGRLDHRYPTDESKELREDHAPLTYLFVFVEPQFCMQSIGDLLFPFDFQGEKIITGETGCCCFTFFFSLLFTLVGRI